MRRIATSTTAGPVSRERAGRSRPARRGGAWVVSLALLLLLALAPRAGADVGATIIERCTHHQSISGFSQADYRKALQDMPAEVSEYSACESLIRKAQLAAAGGGSGGGGASGGADAGQPGSVAPPSPSEQRALQHAHSAGAKPVAVGSAVIEPGVVHANVASALSSLPTPLLLVLVFLLACVLLILGRAVQSRVRARRAG